MKLQRYSKEHLEKFHDEQLKLQRYSKEHLEKFHDEQLKLPIVGPGSKPHQIVRCCKCDSAKLKFCRSGDDELYYICECGFESEPVGECPAHIK